MIFKIIFFHGIFYTIFFNRTAAHIAASAGDFELLYTLIREFKINKDLTDYILKQKKFLNKI